MASHHRFDIIVIGAGPGGYVAAIRAAQMGKKVALIERDQLGGTCLNYGCIPTKTLIAGSDILHEIKRSSEFGITVGSISFDYRKMKERKDGIVKKIRTSLEGLIRSNKIEIIVGEASFVSPYQVKVSGANPCLLDADKIIIATGSKPMDISHLPCDHEKVFNSTSILELATLPTSLAIVGGGYIGCEFASLFAELGVKVTIIEALDSIVKAQGKTISDALTKALIKRSVSIEVGSSVKQLDKSGPGVKLELENGKVIEADIALISIGRSVVSDSLKLENAGIRVDEKGRIPVDGRMETSVSGIFAIGDVTGKLMLAHVASHQGIIAGENACGMTSYMHYHAVPAIIFTSPEIATVGLTLEEALKEGYMAKSSRYPLQALGKAQASKEVEGFVEIVFDSGSSQILGAQMLGAGASDLISEMTLAIQNELTLQCIKETIHAHPTMAEGWLEASFIASGMPIHFPPKG